MLKYFKDNGRDLPWRKTSDPYHILVSEVMLQQTQVDRVIPKYLHFIRQFPGIKALARAPLADVLFAWSGLGYNRRAVYLQKACQEVLERFGGVLPREQKDLETLPGIGRATSASISAFAFNQPTVFIETNIRSVFIHEFFADRKKVDDEQILPLVEQTLDKKNAKRWYNALMDYGAHLKSLYGNPSRHSLHHTKQLTFAGSDRQIRGQILITLLSDRKIQIVTLAKKLKVKVSRLVPILNKMSKEKLILQSSGVISIG